MNFASDNNAPAAPEVMAAVAEANSGSEAAYGADPWTAALEARLAEVFECEPAVFLTTTGTAANALAISAFCPPWGSVLCHRAAHIEEDECGAPEFFAGGAKLVLTPGDHGRLQPAALAAEMRQQGARGVHQTQPAVLSITQATEAGTLYSLEEVRALAGAAHERGMAVHMDGTRFASALARSGASPADMSWKAGVDVLCLGASKCGAMAAEAILLFGAARAKAEELGYRRKRGGHLLSKMRFTSAQMSAWLEDGLWLRLAGHANAMADRLAAGLSALPGVRLRHPVEANLMFAELPVAAHRALRSAGARYYLDPPWQPEPEIEPEPGRKTGRDASAEGAETVGVRLVCSHATTAAAVDRFLEIAGAGALEHDRA